MSAFDRPTVWANWCRGGDDAPGESLTAFRARVRRVDASLEAANEWETLVRAAHRSVPRGRDHAEYEHAARTVVYALRARLAQQRELQRRRAQHETPRSIPTRVLEDRYPEEEGADEWRTRID